MPLAQFFSLFESADASGSRSSALRPLGWLAAILAASLTLSLPVKLYSLAWALFALLAVTVGAYIICYAYFMVKDPNALRSERFNLQRLHLEQSRTGDDIAGFVQDGSSLVEARPALIQAGEQ